MELLIICLAAFLVAILTFFSGFGLGTLLTPFLLLYFPVEQAIALTAVVHFCNNLFKLTITARHANIGVLLWFGIPAVMAAFFGAWVLRNMAAAKPLFQYEAFNRLFTVYPVAFIIAVLLFTFALLEVLPFTKQLQFARNKLPIGGFLSGFFGGLSGNQGALRSAFLIRAGLSKEAFVGTTVVVSTFVDITRLSVYAGRMQQADILSEWPLVLSATLSAICGAYLGNRLLKKITLRFVQIVVACLLFLVAIALGAGFIS